MVAVELAVEEAEIDTEVMELEGFDALTLDATAAEDTGMVLVGMLVLVVIALAVLGATEGEMGATAAAEGDGSTGVLMIGEEGIAATATDVSCRCCR